MGNIDRRIIYALTALVVLVPLLKPLGLPIAISKEVTNSYQVLCSVPDGSTVLMGFDYEPGATAEMTPQALAVLRILSAKNMRVVAITSFPVSGAFAETALKSVYGAAGKAYGTDYVNLGYYAGAESSLAAFCENPGTVFKADYHGTPLSDLPIMSDVKNINSFALAITLNDGPGTGSNADMWVRQVNIAHEEKLLLGVVAVLAAPTMPYVNSKNAAGIMVGLKAAAELEKVSNMPGTATAAMDALSLGHLLVIILIILGNVTLLYKKRTSVKDNSGRAAGGVTR